MLLNISQIGQIALPSSDVDRSEAFYEQVVGLRKLFRFGDLTMNGFAAKTFSPAGGVIREGSEVSTRANAEYRNRHRG